MGCKGEGGKGTAEGTVERDYFLINVYTLSTNSMTLHIFRQKSCFKKYSPFLILCKKTFLQP